jgi:hypothetical protein
VRTDLQTRDRREGVVVDVVLHIIANIFGKEELSSM